MKGVIKRFQGTGMNVFQCPICRAANRDWCVPVFIPIDSWLAAKIRTYGAVTVSGVCQGTNPFGKKHEVGFTVESPNSNLQTRLTT